MKKIATIIVTVAMLAFVRGAFAADWTYDSSAGTITDGDWTFAATVKNTTELTVGTVSADPGASATLDFSKPVTDSNSQSYTIVKLNPNFSGYANKANLATLILPTSGLTEISKDAFNGCSSLTSVTPFLPDCVTTIGNAVFSGAPVAGKLTLGSVVTVSSSSFKGTKITNVYFGASIKTINGGWTSGCFDGCSELTTLEFDPGISGATITGQDNFARCPKITGTVDLSGFTSLGARIFYSYGGSISKVILSSDLVSASPGVFDYLDTLKAVEFTGGVPKDKNFYEMYNNTSRVTLSGVVTTVKEEYKDEWAEYCEGGSINEIDSTWNHELVPAAATKGFYLVYKGAGTSGDLGNWIFNGTAITNVTYGWGFTATANGRLLVLGNCTMYPSTPSPLDFTDTITDAEGGPMAIASYSKLFHNGGENDPSLAGAEMVSSLIAPTNCTIVGAHSFRGCVNMTSAVIGEKIVSVGTGAFRGCTSLTEVVPFLPDTLQTLNVGAFRGCPLTNYCRLAGIVNIDSSAIRGTQIRDIYIGPFIKWINGGYTNGGISYNTELTNITFAAGSSGADMPKEHTLCGNTKLAGTLDLRGFSRIIGGRPFDNSLVTNIIFGAGFATTDGGLLEGLSRLQSLYFEGEPPTGIDNIFNQPNRNSRIGKNQDVVTYVYYANTGWRAYAQDGVLNGRNSTWSTNNVASEVTDMSKRRLLLVDPPRLGLVIIVR